MFAYLYSTALNTNMSSCYSASGLHSTAYKYPVWLDQPVWLCGVLGQVYTSSSIMQCSHTSGVAVL